MIRAYDERYLDDAMRNLGDAADYAVNDCRFAPDVFMDLFLASGLADLFGAGAVRFVSGMSGAELVQQVCDRCGLEREFPEPSEDEDCSAEYWGGWILAYYQWSSGRSFRNICRVLPFGEIIRNYPALHEASERRAADALAETVRVRETVTRLQTYRKALGLSQKELAERSGVSLRMIQQYEQRAKDIDRASAASLAALAGVLHCRMEDLLEFVG